MGVVIPDAADYGTPVPRAATTVQSYGVGQPVQQDVAAWTYAAQSAKAAADSDAKAMEGVGVEIAKWSDQLQTTQAQDSLNQLRARRQELTTGDNGFMKVQGGNVVNPAGGQGTSIYETFPTQFQGHADDIGLKLSGKAAMLYKQAMAAEITGFKSDVARHGLAEGEKYRGAVYKDLQTQLDNKIASSSDPAEVDKGIADKIASATQYAISIGMPGAAAAKAAGSDAAMLVIQKAVNTGDSGAASAALTKYGTYLDAKDRIRVDGLVKTLANQDSAVSEAGAIRASVLGGGTGGDLDNNIGNITTSQFQYSGGKGAPKGAFETFQTPEHGVAAAYHTVQAKAKQNGGTISFIELIGGNGKVKGWAPAANGSSDPLLKGNDPNSYAARLAAAVGLKPGDAVPVGDDAKMQAILRMMNVHEKGKQTVKDDAFGRGIQLAKGDTSVVAAPAAKRSSDPLFDDGPAVDPMRDPLGGKDNVVAGQENGALYKDPDALLYQLNQQFAAMTRANQERFATNIGKRTLVQTELELWHTAQKKQIEQMRLAQKVNLNQVMTTGGPDGKGPTHEKQIPTELWAQLSFRERESVTNIIKHNAKGTEAVTDQQHWYEIQRGLTSADPVERQKWADYDLWQSKDKLDNKDLQELAKMQGVVRRGDPDKQTTHVRNINQLVDDTLLKLRIDSTPKAGSNDATKAYEFRRFVQDQITALEATQPGKKATTEQQQNIIDRAALDIVMKKGRLWDDTKPRYALTIKDIPAEDKTKIIDALTRKNAAEAAATKTQPKAISESDIIDAFARKNAQAPK